MEELLNKLIEKGWRPFKIKSDNMCLYCLKGNKIVISYYEFDTEGECNHEDKRCDYRQLTSKESGLWQFCCKNGMVARKWQGASWLGGEPENCFNYKDYEYRLIESALCNEEALEKFLLENIKVS